MEKELPPIVDSNEATPVHLSYIRRDIAEIKSVLNGLQNNYVTRVDFDDHKKVSLDHESRIRLLEKNMWKWTGASGIISAAVMFLLSYFLK